MLDTIDAHIHFWDLSNQFNSWVYNEKKQLQKNYTPNELPIKNFVHIEAHDSRIDTSQEIDWLENSFKNINIRYIGFLNLYNELDEINTQVTRLQSNPKIVGYRHILSYHPKSPYSPLKDDQLPNDFQKKLAILAQNNKIFECQMYPDQILKTLDIIDNASVKTAIEHCGLPYFGDLKDIKTWEKMIIEISKNSNIVLKLSGLDMFNLNEKQKINCIEHMINFIPANRLCYGSNYPVCNTEHYLNWYHFLKNRIDPKDQDHIFSQTAFDTYWR